MRNRGAFSIFQLLLLITGLLVLFFFIFPALKQMVAGGKSVFLCDGECRQTCDSDYKKAWKGHAYCRETWGEGDSAGGPVCCEPVTSSSPIIGRQSDIKVIYNNDKDSPLRNGATAELLPKSDSSKYWAEGTFSISFGDSVKDKPCYWQVGETDWAEDVVQNMNGNQLMSQLYGKYKTYEDGGTGPRRTLRDVSWTCDDYKGKSTLKVGENTEESFKYMGNTLKFSLVVLDPDSCEDDEDIDLCDSSTFTFNAAVPDKNPVISLEVDDITPSSGHMNKLAVDDTHKFELTVREPFGTCTVRYKNILNLTENLPLPFTGVDGTFPVLFENDKCFAKDPWKEQFELNIPKEMARAIPFELEVNTTMELSGDDRVYSASYPFQIKPEQRVRVTGPSPAMTREKNIDISCHDVSCNKFEVGYPTNPLDCSPGRAAQVETGFEEIQNLTAYGGPDSAMWRFTVKTEEYNGRYVCVKASTGQGAIYSLGLHQDLPAKMLLDMTPPTLTVNFNSWQGFLSFECVDTGEFVSGCKERPFSYAFITDPLMFVTNILTGGTLDAEFNGCPNAETGYWVHYNSDKAEMPYVSRDVRVICVKAEDNAGNYDTQSKLLFSSQEVLALFLREVAE